MNAKGFVHKYGDNVDTDVIIPARYLNIADKKELATHCMEDIDTNFVKVVKDGDVMVGGYNFGCGSSREHAPMVIKESGISCVIAKTFARIFYRNAINIGLAILECPEATAGTRSPSTSTPALSPTSPRARPTRPTLSPTSSRRSSRPGASWRTSKTDRRQSKP